MVQLKYLQKSLDRGLYFCKGLLEAGICWVKFGCIMKDFCRQQVILPGLKKYALGEFRRIYLSLFISVFVEKLHGISRK